MGTSLTDEERLRQLGELLYTLPIDVKRRVGEDVKEYLIAEGQAEQLSLLFGNGELTPPIQGKLPARHVGGARRSEPKTDRTIDERISSVWEGDDSELIERMLRLYPRKPPKLILDATVNEGRFWRGSARRVIGLDVDIGYSPEVVGDSMCLPFKSSVFDVVVYDPPHIPNQGADKTKDFNTRFGLKLKSSVETDYNFAHMYPPFMREAYRVLKPEGVLFCKITDYVHNHRLQWAHVDLLRAATAVGFSACDCIVKIRKGPIIDPKWKVAHHARRRHCYWLIFRKSRKCE